MAIHRILCLVVIYLIIPNTIRANHPNLSDSGGFQKNEVDSEEELQLQLKEIHAEHRGWTEWSDWSACSRSCDGGVSRQLRSCRTSNCHGERVRYKICNMQPCPEKTDFRADQCSAFDSVQYKGVFYKWVPYHDENEPCALICRGMLPAEESEGVEEADVVLKLSDKVHDGTLCRQGSLDMCIEGQCQRVGCDLRIGSTLQTDECGTCGGDGTCIRPLYAWLLKQTSLCSVTCGGGYKMVHAVCQNRVTGREVEPRLCNASEKPEARVLQCNNHRCPPRWFAGEWGACSENCGEGTRMREVQCKMESNNSKTLVNDSECTGTKPYSQETCAQTICPKWETSTWSGCSVSCGEGAQVRIVECTDKDDKPSNLCSTEEKPPNTKVCSTGIQCPLHTYLEQAPIDIYPLNSNEDDQPADEIGIHAEMLVDEQIAPSENTFIPDEWGPCSVTCGHGTRRREVHCKIFLELSRTIVKLADEKCAGPKPPETESCFLHPCASEKIDAKDDPYRTDANIRVGGDQNRGTTYSWKEHGYTHCSATCLGGVQELIVHCVRDDTQKIISPYLCPKELKPEILIRTCNDHACPPRWNYSDFSPCSQTCGIGIQTRDVNCIHEVTQGSSIARVPNNRCPQPPPPDRQYCNVLDCPIRWKVSEWSRCSKTCGSGEKTRRVECKQVMAQNHTVDRPAAKCPPPKPPDRKPCNTKSCVLESDKPQIDISNSTFIQHDAKKKKISLKIGGAATVFEGTIVKIKCPVKRFNRTKIMWKKDNRLLPKSKKYKTSKKGALRIQSLVIRDSGVYSCVAGKSVANLMLTVRHVPGKFPNSEEIQKQMYKNNDRDFELADVQTNRDDLIPKFITDDQSHEQRPYLHKQKSSVKPILFTPTLPSQVKVNVNQPSTVQDIFPTSALGDSPTLDHTNTPSSGSRTVPHFQQLITNLQLLTAARHRRMVETPEKNYLDNISKLEEETYRKILDKVVLENIINENVQFEWNQTDWSSCSQTCGGSGSQMRSVNCVVKYDNGTQNVDQTFCKNAGLKMPSTIRKCGFGECPNWSLSRWIPCKKLKCFSWNSGIKQVIGQPWTQTTDLQFGCVLFATIGNSITVAEQSVKINQHFVQM